MTADLVFTGDRWLERHAFVIHGGSIAAVGQPSELEESHPHESRQDCGDVDYLSLTATVHG